MSSRLRARLLVEGKSPSARVTPLNLRVPLMQNAPGSMSTASADERTAISSAGPTGEEGQPPIPRSKTEISLQDQSVRMSNAKLLFVFVGLSLTIFTAFMDQVMVATAEPIIGSALNAGASISWVGTSYLIANTSCQLLYGRLSDIFGRKILLFSALFLFGFGDLVAGFSTSPAMLYIFRSIAGVGGGGMLNLSMVIVSDVVSLKERGKWQGVLSAGAAAGSACGPFVGALLSENVSWRWVFWIMAPLAAACAGFLFYLPLKPVRGSAREKLLKIDYGGAVLSLAGSIFILIPISAGGSIYAWDSPIVITLLTVGGITWLLFFLMEWKFAKLPVLPLRLWTFRTPSLVLAATFLTGMIYYGNLFFLPIYFQVVRGWSPTISALLLLALLLVQVASSLIAGMISTKTAGVVPQIRVGFALWVTGSGLQLLFDRETSKAEIAGLLLLQGFGVGFTLQTTLVAAQAGCPPVDRAVVTGARNCLRSMGGAFGLAMCNAILNNVLQANLPLNLPASTRDQIIHGITVNLPGDIDDVTRNAVFDAYQSALHSIFLSFVPIVGVAFILTMFMKETPLRGNEEQEKALSSDQSADGHSDKEEHHHKT